MEPNYHVLNLLDAEKEYFITRLDEKLCVLDKTGAVIKTMEEPGIRTFSKLGEIQGKRYYETGDADYMNHLLDENFNEIKMPDRMEFAGFLDMDKGLIRVIRPIVERPNTYYANEAVIDLQGSVVIPFEEDLCNLELLGDNLISAYRFSDSPVPAGLGWSKTCPYVILDRQGKVVVDSCDRFTQAGDNGWVGIQKGEESFYIDQSGEVVLYPPEGYAVQGVFSEGLASVADTNTVVFSGYGITAYQTAYMDKTGKIVIEGDSDWGEGSAFENGIASIVRYPGNAMPTQTTYIKYVGNAPSAWAEDLVGKAREMGILKDEAVYYRLSVSRETFCELVYALLDTMPGMQWEKPSVNPFRDTENEKVLALSGYGIIEGKGAGLFAPHDSLTREEAATIALRVGKLVQIETAGQWDGGMYADDKDISHWAKEAVYALRQLGIMQGTEKGFEPKAQYTLEESVVTLMRLYNLMEQQH